MGIEIKIECKKGEKDEEVIKLTGNSVDKFNKRIDQIDGSNEYMSRNLKGFEIWGKVYCHNDSSEIMEVNKLSRWSKKHPIDKDGYRKFDVKLYDTNGRCYSEIHLDSVFVLEYNEEYAIEDGVHSFYVYLREFDNAEKGIKK